MLMMSVDIAYPEKQLLKESCDVGIGARQALRRLVAAQEPRKALKEATAALNASKVRSARHFWNLLSTVEDLAQERFAQLPLAP